MLSPFSFALRYVLLSQVGYKPMCNIVLGARIERALWAAQRDGGWNCKGARNARPNVIEAQYETYTDKSLRQSGVFPQGVVIPYPFIPCIPFHNML